LFLPAGPTASPTEVSGSRIGLSGPCGLGDLLGFINRPDPPPAVDNVFCAAKRSIGQQEQSRLAVLGVAGAAMARDLDEPERDQFTDGWRNRLPVDAIFDEVIVRAGADCRFRQTYGRDC
jgi:hypothetical protein